MCTHLHRNIYIYIHTYMERSECQEPCPRVRPPWVRNHPDACPETRPDVRKQAPNVRKQARNIRKHGTNVGIHTMLAGYERANSLSHALQFWPFEHLNRQLYTAMGPPTLLLFSQLALGCYSSRSRCNAFSLHPTRAEYFRPASPCARVDVHGVAVPMEQQ